MVPQAIPRSSTPKKDKLKKKERLAAEKHLLKFGESIRQIERHSDNHAFRPRSSYFPAHILSLILDTLLIICFPSDLDHILNNSWAYYSSHGSALFDSIIEIQTTIAVQRNNARELTLAKQREKRQAAKAINDDDASPILSDSDPECSEETFNELSEQQLNEFPARKRQALKDTTNTAKRQRRAPRATQLSVAEVLQDYGPRYRTRRNALVEGSSGGGNEKENGGLRRSKRH